jgi:hypothetical protein
VSWRRIFFLVSGLVVAIVAATLLVLQHTGAASGFVRAALARILVPAFELRGADLSVTEGTLTLHDLRVADPRGAAQRLLAVQRVQVDIDTNPLGRVLAVHAVEIDGLDIHLDLAAGVLPELHQLLHLPDDGTGSDATLPPVTIRRSRVAARLRTDLPLLRLEDIELQLRPRRADDGAIDLRRAELRGTARLADFGVDLAITGNADLDAGSARVAAQIADVALDQALIAKLQPFLPMVAPSEGVRGHVRQSSLWLEIGPRSGPSSAAIPEIGVTAGIDHVDCRIPQLPYPVHDASLRLVGSTRDHGEATIEIRKSDAAGNVHLQARLRELMRAPDVEIRGRATDIAVDDDALSALQAFAAGRAIVTALQPSGGLADVDLYLRNPGTDAELVELDTHVRGVRMTYHGFGPPDRRVAFPLPLASASGHVHLRDSVLSIEDVVAQVAEAAGGGSVALSGRVGLGGRGGDRVAIDLQATAVQFSRELRAAMGKLLHDDGALYDRLAPTGTAAVTLRLRPEDEPGGGYRLSVRPRAASLRYADFPWRVDRVGGEVVVSNQGVDIDLHGRHGASEVHLTGRARPPQDDPDDLTGGALELRVAATGAELDGDLEAASTHLAPGLAQVWDELRPTGRTGAILVLQRAGAARELEYDLQLDLTGVATTPRFLPLPVVELAGQAFVHGDGERQRVELDTLRGRIRHADGKPAELAVIGSIDTSPSYREDITAVVRDLRLDDRLASALHAAGTISAGTWNTLRPSGLVDVVHHHLREGKAPPRHRVDVHLRGVQSDAAMLPQRATDIHGDVQMAGGRITFRDVHGRMCGASVVCTEGSVEPADAGRTDVRFAVTTERFPVNDDLARLFPGRLGQAVLDRQLSGHANVNALRLRFLVPQEGSDAAFETMLAGQIEALDVEMLLGTRLRAINGVVDIAESHVTATDGALRGTIARGSLRFLDHPCLDVHADFVADARQVAFARLGFTLHGGSVRGPDPAANAIVYRLPAVPGEPSHLAVDVRLDGVSLSELLASSGIANTPYRGTLGGAIRVEDLPNADLVDMTALGNFTVIDANLGAVPLFTAIYAQLPEQNRPHFDTLSMAFDLRDRGLRIDELQLASPLLAVTGSGTMTMDGYVDVRLQLGDLFGDSADLLLLPEILRFLTNQFVRFHLYGHLRDLRAEQRWLAERNPRRQPLLPAPPRAQKAQRPDF